MANHFTDQELSRSRHFKNSLKLIGRVLLSAIFLITAMGQIFSWNGVMIYYQTNSSTPVALFFRVTAIILQILGGISLLLGYRTRIGAILLIIFIIPVTLYFHHFWDLDDISQLTQIQLFFKNIAIIGGLFGIVANGAGSWSIDGRFLKSRK